MTNPSVAFPRSYWVIPGKFLAGCYPGSRNPRELRKHVEGLLDCGIRRIINLMEENETDGNGEPFVPYEPVFKEIAAARGLSVSCIRMPIRDLYIPSAERMRGILDEIDEATRDGAAVYVHCWGGKGRTGTVVGCYLAEAGIATGQDALEKIKELRKYDPMRHQPSPETDAQRSMVRSWKARKTVARRNSREFYEGCFLGGAVGDALGAAVEFMGLRDIRRTFGEAGIREFAPCYGKVGAITDDTQMTLFTAEGLLGAIPKHGNMSLDAYTEAVRQAYQRWLVTQGYQPVTMPGKALESWLFNVADLHHRRAPGSTCLSALHGGKIGTVDNPINDSKGCGAVMRVAPAGLVCATLQWDGAAGFATSFDMGCQCGAITHGHPSGYLSAGCLAALIFGIIAGKPLEESIRESLGVLVTKPGHQECLRAVEAAVALSKDGRKQPSPETVETLGGGWVGEEALAISVYCALVAGDDFEKGIRLAVNHSGDSDSSGAITGNILGALLGRAAIPDRWLAGLELREIIEEVARDLFMGYPSAETDEPAWRKKYRPC